MERVKKYEMRFNQLKNRTEENIYICLDFMFKRIKWPDEEEKEAEKEESIYKYFDKTLEFSTRAMIAVHEEEYLKKDYYIALQ